MEKQLLAVGCENYSNYIKLPESILTEFNKPKKSDALGNLTLTKPKKGKHKSINLREQLEFTNEVNILPPYYFSIESTYGKFTYCGVLDFTADEGMVLIPHGVLTNLDVYGSDFVTIRYIANVPKGDFVQLEPIQREIFDIPELDKYLESVISKYCLLYPEQILTCTYAGEQFSIKVKLIKSVCEFDVEPELIDIVNTDLKIDIFNRFLEEELKEQERKRIEKEQELKRLKEKEEEIKKQKEAELSKQNPNPGVFTGTGMKLGGGFETSDPVLMREIRLQRLMALQAQNPPCQPNKQVISKPTTQSNPTGTTVEIKNQAQMQEPIQLFPNVKKPNKKSKDIEL